MQVSVTAVDTRQVHLAGNRQHRRITGPGGAQGGRGIQQARTRHDGVHTHFAGGLCVAKCHVGSALFVAGMDDVDLAMNPKDSVKQVIELAPRQAEYGVHIMAISASTIAPAPKSWHKILAVMAEKSGPTHL